jgi:hypothetical protein
VQALLQRASSPAPQPTAGYRRLALAELPEETRRAMVRLAAHACGDLDVEAYLGERLRRYGSVALWKEADGALSAFILVDEFVEDGERYIYFGPLFSRGGACVKLVVGLVSETLCEHPRASVHFAAELQSPEALLLFKRLFLRTSFPSVTGAATPRRIARVLGEYARRLPHMGPVDLENLSTRAGETLFRPQPELEPVVRLLAARGVDLARGDSQILIVSCDPSPRGRARLWLDLREGMRAIADWKTTRAELLTRIAELAG